MSKKNIKLLHGMVEIAGQGYYSVKGIRRQSIKSNMAVFSKNIFGYPVDLNLRISRKLSKLPWEGLRVICFFIKALFKYNFYHFHFGRSLLPFCIDVPILKLVRKKVFIEFHGSDIRWTFNRNPKDYNCYACIQTLPPIKKRTLFKLKGLIRFSDVIVLHDQELLAHVPSFYHNKIRYIPLRIDIDKFVPVYPNIKKKKVRIVHAPSKRTKKGTEYVLTAIDKLKNDYEIEFVLVEGMSNEDAIKIYQSADIIVDQLLVGTYGVFACEAMALGKPVVTYISEEMINAFPKSLPIISANYLNIERILRELICNGSRRRELGIQGRVYVENYHDYRKIGKLLSKLYLNSKIKYTHLEAFEAVKTSK